MAEHRLPDLLKPDLRVVFVGTAAGKRSAEQGEYYAGPGNRFWQTLHEVGLTPRRLQPGQFRDLLALGIGLTDMSKLGVGMDHQVSKNSFDRGRFEANMTSHRPRVVAFTSKKAASVWLGQSRTALISYGRLGMRRSDFPEVFVLPSTSGAARSHWSIEPWQELARWVKLSA